MGGREGEREGGSAAQIPLCTAATALRRREGGIFFFVPLTPDASLLGGVGAREERRGGLGEEQAGEAARRVAAAAGEECRPGPFLRSWPLSRMHSLANSTHLPACKRD